MINFTVFIKDFDVLFWRWLKFPSFGAIVGTQFLTISFHFCLETKVEQKIKACEKYAKNFFATLNPANSPVVILSGGGDWASAGFALPSAAPDLRNNSLNAIFSRPLSPTIFLPVTALGASFGSVADGLRSSNGAAFASSLVPRATASRYVLRSGFEKKTYPAFVLHQPSVKPLARA